jgi:hypothetical protein
MTGVCSSLAIQWCPTRQESEYPLLSDALLIPAINEAKIGDVLPKRWLLMNLEGALVSFQSCDRGSGYQRTPDVRRRNTRLSTSTVPLILTAVPLRVRMEFRFTSVQQTNSSQQRSFTSIQTHHDTAESNWRDLTTFGDCHCHHMIGMTVTPHLIVSRLRVVNSGEQLFKHPGEDSDQQKRIPKEGSQTKSELLCFGSWPQRCCPSQTDLQQVTSLVNRLPEFIYLAGF